MFQKKAMKAAYSYKQFESSLNWSEDNAQQITNKDNWTWCFSDRASWIDYILFTNFCAMIIIYS